MIGTDYTPGLLAELAKKPNVRSLELPVTPKGQWVSSCTKRYTDDWVCKTTLFDVGRLLEEGLDKVSIVLSPAASVELKSEIGAVSVLEETDTTSDVITSFFEDETSDEPC